LWAQGYSSECDIKGITSLTMRCRPLVTQKAVEKPRSSHAIEAQRPKAGRFQRPCCTPCVCETVCRRFVPRNRLFLYMCAPFRALGSSRTGGDKDYDQSHGSARVGCVCVCACAVICATSKRTTTTYGIRDATPRRSGICPLQSGSSFRTATVIDCV
jgi:hypothetical protein